MSCCPVCDDISSRWAEREQRRRAHRAEMLRYLAIVGAVIALMVFNALADLLPA